MAMQIPLVLDTHAQSEPMPDEPIRARQEVRVIEFGKAQFPTLRKNGKIVVVSQDEYIKHHLKGATTKYKLITVPDG